MTPFHAMQKGEKQQMQLSQCFPHHECKATRSMEISLSGGTYALLNRTAFTQMDTERVHWNAMLGSTDHEGHTE